MVGPERKREAVVHVQHELEVSERRACTTLRQPRSTQRYGGRKRSKDAALCAELRRISWERIRDELDQILLSPRPSDGLQLMIDLGLAAKGDDCEAHGGHHEWYNAGDAMSACYHCKIERPGQLWALDHPVGNERR